MKNYPQLVQKQTPYKTQMSKGYQIDHLSNIQPQNQKITTIEDEHAHVHEQQYKIQNSNSFQQLQSQLIQNPLISELLLKIKHLQQQLQNSKQRQRKLKQNNKQLTDMLISANQHSVKKNQLFVEKIEHMIQNMIQQKQRPKGSTPISTLPFPLKNNLKQFGFRNSSNCNTFNVKSNHCKTYQNSKQIQKLNSYNLKQNIDSQNHNKSLKYSPIRMKTQSYSQIGKSQASKMKTLKLNQKQMCKMKLLQEKVLFDHNNGNKDKTMKDNKFQIYQKIQKKFMRV